MGWVAHICCYATVSFQLIHSHFAREFRWPGYSHIIVNSHLMHDSITIWPPAALVEPLDAVSNYFIADNITSTAWVISGRSSRAFLLANLSIHRELITILHIVADDEGIIIYHRAKCQRFILSLSLSFALSLLLRSELIWLLIFDFCDGILSAWRV